MLSLLMTTEYAQAEERHELQRLLLRVAGGEREALAELYQRTRSARRNGTPVPRRSADWTPMSAPLCSKRWQALRARNGVSCCSMRSRV